MLQENVEVVRRIYEEISAHGVLPSELFDPDCVTETDFGVVHGFDATQEALASYFGTFEDFHVEATEILHADEERVVTAIRDGGRIRGSSADVWNRFFHAWTFRHGKVVRLSSHTDGNSALEAVGLSESEADFEVIRQACAAFSSGGVEAQLPFLDPDIEIVPFGASMEGKSYRGHDGVRQWVHHEIDPNWTEFQPIPEEFRRVDHRILVFGQWIAIGRTSGVHLNVAATWIIEVRDAKIVRWQTYTDRDEALQALRVRPFDQPA